MKKRCTRLAIVLFSLLAFGVADADIQFIGVLDPKMNVTRIDSVKLASPDMTIVTPDWFAESGVLDTLAFVGVAAWPETLSIYGTMQGIPVINYLRHPKPDTWYRLSPVIPETPFVMFYGDYGVEESRPVVARPPRLDVNPSIVTGQMTIRLQAVGTSRPVVEIHDAVGNVVRSLGCTAMAEGIATATWNREDQSGRPVPEGVHFCRYANSDVVAVRKVLVVH
jgi:hypothetical protein